MTKKELEEQQELEESVNTLEEIQTYYTDKFDDLEEPIMKEIFKEDELIHKRMNDINTFQAHENEVYLRGTDEYGKDFQICFDSYDFLEWINTEQIEYIKEQLTKYIKDK